MQISSCKVELPTPRPKMHQRYTLSSSFPSTPVSFSDVHAIDPGISPIQQRRHPSHRHCTPDKQHDPLRRGQNLKQWVWVVPVMCETEFDPEPVRERDARGQHDCGRELEGPRWAEKQ